MGSAATMIDEQQEMLAVSNLANLCFLTDKLYGPRGRQRVVEAIESIAMSLSGSDEVAVFEVDRARMRLVLIAASGVDADNLRSIPLGKGLIGRAAAQGTIYERFLEPETSLAGERHLRACIPLNLEHTTVGVVAIFDQHGHYFMQPPLNREWIDVFSSHAASALYWTGVCETAIAALDSEW